MADSTKKSKKKRRKKEKLEHKLKRIVGALVLFFIIMALDELGVLRAAVGEPAALYVSFAL